MSIKRILKNNEWDAIRDANIPSAANPYATINDLGSITGGNQLISGGASYSGTGLVFDVSALEYTIAGVPYNTVATQVTLNAGDPANPRFDAIVADELEVVSVVQGVPAVTPSTPAIGEDQILVQYILVGANATTPSITTEYVYREDQTSDWQGSLSGTNNTADFSSTTPAPQQGTFCCLAEVGRYGKPYGVRFATGSPVSRADYVQLSFWVYLTQNMAAAGKLRGYVFAYADNTTTSTDYLGWARWDQYLDFSLTGVWQLVSIPTALFATNPAITTIGFLNFTLWPNTGSFDPVEFALDDIKLMTGYGPGLNVATIDVLEEGVIIGDTAKLNFVNGTDTEVSVIDDPINNKIDIEINRQFAVEDNGAAIEPTIKGINFTGAGVSVATPGGSNPKVVVTIPGGGGGSGGWTRVTEATATRTAAADEFILVDAVTCTITLPAPADNTVIAIKAIVTPTDIQINTSGVGINIDGTDYSVTGLSLTSQWEQITLISDGSDWFIY
tara:strand:- start:1617 stop:3119 length:1503 start_codon:yes stop_codon:yes gene_type:complete